MAQTTCTHEKNQMDFEFIPTSSHSYFKEQIYQYFTRLSCKCAPDPSEIDLNLELFIQRSRGKNELLGLAHTFGSEHESMCRAIAELYYEHMGAPVQTYYMKLFMRDSLRMNPQMQKVFDDVFEEARAKTCAT